jgi:hypothetical protein
MSAEPQLPFDPEREPLDVGRIMEAIRELNRHAPGGLLSDEELEDRALARFRAFAEKAWIDPVLLERFLRPGHDWNIASDYVIRSHRPGPVAWLSVLAKRLVGRLVRLYTDHPLDRQTQINQYLCHLLHDSIREVVRLEARLAALERRVGASEAGEDRR